MTKQKMPPLRYFFYHGELQKKIHINRGEDLLTAWNYPQHKVEKHVYSDVRRNGERAWSTMQVCKMVRRSRRMILMDAIAAGNIERPQITYSYEGGNQDYAYYWSEKDIMGLHDYLKTIHIGRPRHDGRINTRDLPSAAELRAMIRQGTVLYVQTDSGEFVPTWQAEKF